MEWATKQPTKPGYYWLKRADGKLVIAELYRHPTGTKTVWFSRMAKATPAELDADEDYIETQFLGPIKYPEGPK